MDASWKTILAPEFQKSYFQTLVENINRERKTHQVFPASTDVFKAFEVTPYDDIKVVILGQDPYHNSGQAHGLSFSVQPLTKHPPSLQNIFKELQSDLGCKVPESGSLVPWAKQGVFLLNSVLTVRAHEPASHKGLGWETFTNEVIRLLGSRPEPTVFILWGAYAKTKRVFIEGQHCVLSSPHPSPFSSYQGFFGSKPFSKANEFLTSVGRTPIDWAL